MKKIISKELFCKYINRIISKDKEAENLEKALQQYTGDSDFTGFFYNNEFEVEFLEKLLDDESHWISWWLYEARENPEEFWVECNNVKLVIKTPEELYDFLYQGSEESYNEYFKGISLSLNAINETIATIKNTNLNRKILKGENDKELEDYNILLKLVKNKIKNDGFAKTGIYFIEKDD